MRTQADADVDMFVAPPPVVLTDGGYWPLASGNALAAPGDDNSGNGTPDKPFASVQRAIDELMADWDMAGRYKATIRIAMKPGCGPGVAIGYLYARAKVSGRLLGQGGSVSPMQAVRGKPTYGIGTNHPFSIVGDDNNPMGAALVVGNYGPNANFVFDDPAFSVTEGAVRISGLLLDAGPWLEDCCDIDVSSYVEMGVMAIGNAGQRPDGGYNIGIGVALNSTLMLTGGLMSVGNAMALIQLGGESCLLTNNNTGQTGLLPLKLYGTQFSDAVIAADGSEAYLPGIGWFGSFTGRAVHAYPGSIIANNNNDFVLVTPFDGSAPVSHPILFEPGSIRR